MADTGDLKSPDLKSLAGSSPARGTIISSVLVCFKQNMQWVVGPFETGVPSQFLCHKNEVVLNRNGVAVPRFLGLGHKRQWH